MTSPRAASPACGSPRSRGTSSSASAPDRLAPRTRLALLVATAGGLGRAPLAPGTVASAATALVLWLLALSPVALLGVLVAVTALGTWAADEAERALGSKDPGAIVIDEVAGMTLSVAAVALTPATLLLGFLLFRLFDVVKPFPANVAQRLRGGFGVMVDDLIAGVYVLALLWLARRAGWL
ncbi:MAG: phosphatidylglycerophosphatase A [Candidatus Rokuibacteriota bacterium]|nr:MAG: phosphatidylglycerophosphatase A [Candidatus Rokubacteria bacterium]